MNDIGVVEYFKDLNNNCIRAKWFYIKEGKQICGTGIATGKLSDHFEGEYSVTYFNQNGIQSSKYNLLITKSKQNYELKWLSDNEVKFIGVGMEIEDRLYAGWRSQ